MNNCTQHHQVLYQTICIQPPGLLPVHFNHNLHNITPKNIHTNAHNFAQPHQNAHFNKTQIPRGFVGPAQNSKGILKIDFSQANVTDPSAFLSQSSVTQNTENVPMRAVKQSSNISSDSMMRNRSSWRRSQNEPRVSYRDNKQDNPNINDQTLWKKMPALPPFTGPSQNKSIQTKSKQSVMDKSGISFNTTNNINYQNGKAVDCKNNKAIQNDHPVLLAESRLVQQCKSDNSWNDYQTPTKHFTNPQSCFQNSPTDRNQSTTHNSVVFDSTIMSNGEDLEENQHLDFSKKQSNTQIEHKIDAGVSKQELDHKIKQAVSQMQALLDEQRAKNKQKSEEMADIKKQLEQLSVKYESLLSSQQSELNKRLQKSLQELKCEQDKNIETMIENINQNSSRQLNNIVARFQQSIRVIQEEYNNYKHTAQEQKHTLNTNALTAQRTIQDLKAQIDKLSKKSEVMDRQLQTDMSEVLIEKLDSEQEKQSALLKLNKQSRLIQKLQKKIKEYKSEYERIFYKSEDYRNYIKESELIISDLTRDIHNLQREARNYNKNQASFSNTIEQLSDNIMSMHLHELNKKYKQTCQEEESSDEHECELQF